MLRIASIILATLIAVMVVIGIALAAMPAWLLWPAAVFTIALLFAAASEWLSRNQPPVGWLTPIALMVVALYAVAFGSPGATQWILWPVLLITLLTMATSLYRNAPRSRRRRV